MEEEIDRLFKNIREDSTFEKMFFKKLSETENPFPWFEILEKREYFEPSNNKSPIKEGKYLSVNYWQVLDYLENLTKRSVEKKENRLIEKIIKVIDSIIDYTENGKRIENPHTDWKIIKIIFHLPLEKITNEYIKFIEIALLAKFANSVLISAEIEKSVFPLLVKNRKKSLLLELLKIIIKPKKIPQTPTLEMTSIMEEYWFAQVLEKNRKGIVKICGLETAELVIKQIELILMKNNNAFNIVSIPTIENSSQIMFPNKYDWQLVCLVRTTLEQTNPSDISHLLNYLLQSNHSILNRLAIHVINFHYSLYSRKFWNWKENPLKETDVKHEVYELIKTHKNQFSSKNLDKLLEWIEELTPITQKKPIKPEILKKREAFQKLEWLTAIIDVPNTKVKKICQKYQQIYPDKIEHPGYLYWSSGVQVYDPRKATPFSEELLGKSNQSIAEYLINYKPPEKRAFEIEESLSSSLHRTVRENFERFVTDMHPFLLIPPLYQNSLLSGILDAWNNENDFSWEEVFNFILALITDKSFWRESEKPGYYHKRWIISGIADLIFSGTKSDKHAFESKNFRICEKILLILAEKTKSDIDESSEDIITAVLNAPLGRVLSAMVSFSLRFARVNKKETNQKWVLHISKYFDEMLTNERPIEFDVTLGKFLLQLNYLDSKWAKANINKIFNKEKNASWSYAFSSYLFYSGAFSDEIYLLLKDNNHFRKAFSTKFKQSHNIMKISQNICIAYFRDIESFEGSSLLNDLINHENITYLMELVFFIWRLRDKLDETTKKKIKPLWQKIITRIQNSENKQLFKEILSHLSYWLSIVEEIDAEIFEWLKVSAKYIDQRTESFFIEYLLGHVTNTPRFVAEILYETINVGKHFPKFKKEELIEIINKLYEQNQKNIADRICSLYLSNGYQFLMEVYERYNS